MRQAMFKMAGRRNGKARLLDEQNQWWRILADTTRFVTPDGKVWQIAAINTYIEGRVIDLHEDPHGKATVARISTWKPWRWL